MDCPPCSIDDFGPLPVVRPASVTELCDLVRRAASDGQAIYPLGGRTHLGFGLPPTRPGVAADLTALDRVIDYPARDMTITAEAGIPVGRLQQLLAAEGQRLPIDVPRAETATLGGILAVNASGPRRLGSGTLRDYVIGITVVTDEGHEAKAGGRVVKNVAGYDLCKLHIGALGTLGVITRVTLKVRPRPEAQALVAVGCAADDLGDLLDRLHASRTRPGCLDVLNTHAAASVARAASVTLPDAPWVVVAGFEDTTETVDWQVRQLLVELAAFRVNGLHARGGFVCEPLWRGLTELTGQPGARLGIKANLLPGSVAGLCRLLDQLPEGFHVQAHAGSGIVHAHTEADLTMPRAREILTESTAVAAGARGNLVLPVCPPAWKRELPVWGTTRGDLWLMRQVKDRLDPRRLFNPGRFLDTE